MLIRSVVTLLCLGLFFHVKAQKVMSASGGYAKTDRLSVKLSKPNYQRAAKPQLFCEVPPKSGTL